MVADQNKETKSGSPDRLRLNIPLDVLIVSMSMLGIVSLLCCAVIEKLDKMTEPGYTKASRRKSY